MKCPSVLCTGNVQEIVPYTVSENVKEMCKFPFIRKCTWNLKFPGDFQGLEIPDFFQCTVLYLFLAYYTTLQGSKFYQYIMQHLRYQNFALTLLEHIDLLVTFLPIMLAGCLMLSATDSYLAIFKIMMV